MARKREVDETKYVTELHPSDITLTELAFLVPRVVTSLDTSFIKQAQTRPDWKLYRVELTDGIPKIVREMCDRCGKVWIPPRERKVRRYVDDKKREIYLVSGICKDCINASVYVDKYLDGVPLTEKEAKKQMYTYAEEYEKEWRRVLITAPCTVITAAEWEKACNFFNGCAICGGPVEIQGKFFPVKYNGKHTAWNVIPLCDACDKAHKYGRTSTTSVGRYKIFSSPQWFQKTKTIRMYLLRQMELHDLYIEPLMPYRQRFFETKTLEGSD